MARPGRQLPDLKRLVSKTLSSKPGPALLEEMGLRLTVHRRPYSRLREADEAQENGLENRAAEDIVCLTPDLWRLITGLRHDRKSPVRAPFGGKALTRSQNPQSADRRAGAFLNSGRVPMAEADPRRRTPRKFTAITALRYGRSRWYHTHQVDAGRPAADLVS